MSEKERTRYHLMRLVKSGRLSLKEASDKMGLSYRQSKRVKKRFIEAGARGLIHGNRGRASPRALEPGQKALISISTPHLIRHWGNEPPLIL